MNSWMGLRHIAVIVVAICSLLLCATQSRSATTIESLMPCRPDEPMLGYDYINRVFNSFWKTAEPGPANKGAAVVLVLPSFEPEWALIVGKQEEFAVLEVVVAHPQLWSANWVDVPGTAGRKEWATEPVAVDVERHIAKLRPETSRFLHAYLAELVGGSFKFTLVDPGVDGTTYRFYAPGGQCGSCWSPKASTRSGKAVKLIEEIRAFVTTDEATRNGEFEDALLEKLRELMSVD